VTTEEESEEEEPTTEEEESTAEEEESTAEEEEEEAEEDEEEALRTHPGIIDFHIQDYDQIIDNDVVITSAMTISNETVLYTGNVTIAASVTVSANATVVVLGTVNIDSGMLILSGNMYCLGDFRIQSKDINGTFGATTGYTSLGAGSKLTVYGDFYTQTTNTNNFGNGSTANPSILELYGDFNQIGTNTFFKNSQYHVTVFAGNDTQNVSFDRYDNLATLGAIHATNLHLTNPVHTMNIGSNMTLSGAVNVSNFNLNGNDVTVSALASVIAGGLDTGTLTVNGNLGINETLNVNGGALICNGNIDVDASGALQNSSGTITCTGNLTIDNGQLNSGGLVEVFGDFTIGETATLITSVWAMTVVRGDYIYNRTLDYFSQYAHLKLYGNLIITNPVNFKIGNLYLDGGTNITYPPGGSVNFNLLIDPGLSRQSVTYTDGITGRYLDCTRTDGGQCSNSGCTFGQCENPHNFPAKLDCGEWIRCNTTSCTLLTNGSCNLCVKCKICTPCEKSKIFGNAYTSIAPYQIHIPKKPSPIAPGQTYEDLNVIEFPSMENHAVTWESSNANIAQIDANSGVITAIAEGATMIKARSTTNSNFTIQFLLKIENPKLTLSISGKPPSNTLNIGQTWSELTAKVSPASASQDVIWSIKTPPYGVATIGPYSGQLEATGVGFVTVIAKSVDDPTVNDSFRLRVRRPEPTSISIDGRPPNDTLSIGQTWSNLNAVIYPLAASQAVTWSLSPTTSNVVSINPTTGEIVPLNSGVVVIKATSNVDSTVSASFGLTVKEGETNLTVYHFYDDGYRRRFSPLAWERISSYQDVVSDIYNEIFNLNIETGSIHLYNSIADDCRTSGSLTAPCQHWPTCDLSSNAIRADLIAQFGSGDSTLTKFAWSGHLLDGNPSSYSYSTSHTVVITILHSTDSSHNNHTDDVVRYQSIFSLLHETAHQVGANDHYCYGYDPLVEPSCVNAHCYRCNKLTRPNCAMTRRMSDIETRARNTIFCTDCAGINGTIPTHLKNHH
ncbi:MAG: Ig-like domain-containing protein, partial [Oscillospiraceae bacterium]|nr:Ig-like domain-containing protein [Oscillospiraceae bacterium]